MKARGTGYVILSCVAETCWYSALLSSSPVILQVLSPLCPAVIQLFVFSHGCFLIQNYRPWSRVRKIRVFFKPVVPLTKQMMVTGNFPFLSRSSPTCQQFPITASAIPAHRNHLATFRMLLWPCLHFHFQELFRLFFRGIVWQHLDPFSALLGEVSREGAWEGGREQKASERQSRGRLEGAATSPPCKPCQHPCWKHHLCHHLAEQFLPVLAEFSFSQDRGRFSLPGTNFHKARRVADVKFA